MCDQTLFRPRAVLTAFCAAAIVSVFGADPVRAQTTPPMTSAQVDLGGGAEHDAAGSRPPALDRRGRRAGARAEPRSAGRAASTRRCRTTPSRSRPATGCRTSRRSSRRVIRSSSPQDIFSGTQATITQGSMTTNAGFNQLLPWGGQLPGRLEERSHHHQQRLQPLQAPAQFDVRRQLLAAAAAQLQDRRVAPAVSGQQEEPRDLGRAAGGSDRADRPQRQERVLGSGLRHQQPRSAAAVALARPAVAARQPRARRDRHHGADRHHRGAGRSGAARRERHSRRGVHLARRRSAARAHLESGRSPTSGRCASSRPMWRRSCR